MFRDDLGKPTGEPFVRLGLLLQNVAGKNHVVFVLFQHIGHPLVGGRADSRHGGLRLLIGLHADLVDAVRHVLLLRCLQRFCQRIIKHHALLGVRLQLVDQHHLGGGLVLQAVDPGLSLFDIAFKGLAVGQLDLFILNHLIVGTVQRGQFGFQGRALGRIRFRGDLVL